MNQKSGVTADCAFSRAANIVVVKTLQNSYPDQSNEGIDGGDRPFGEWAEAKVLLMPERAGNGLFVSSPMLPVLKPSSAPPTDVL